MPAATEAFQSTVILLVVDYLSIRLMVVLEAVKEFIVVEFLPMPKPIAVIAEPSPPVDPKGKKGVPAPEAPAPIILPPS